MLNIIDRYIAKLFCLYFFAGLLVFVTIFTAVDFMSSFLKHDVSMAIVLEYYSYAIPGVIYQMVPMASLLATVFTLSNLNKSSELIALFSLGFSLARVSAPILVVVSIVSTMSFWVGDRILPRVNQKKNYVKYVKVENKPGLYSTVKTDKIWYRSENVILNIKSLNATNKKAQGLTLYYFNDNWDLVQLITAQEVNMNEGSWNLQKGSVTLFTRESSFPLTLSFNEKSISVVEELADIQNTSSSSEVMDLKLLRKFINKNKEAGLDTLHYEVEYHSKFGFAFAAFVMSLMGIPFSVARQRSGSTMVNAGKCIGLAFMYWTLYSSFLSFGKYGAVPPIIAAWAPNILMVMGSIYLLLRLKK